MNIYEEAKEELIEIETYLEHSLDHISKALERAKKEHELLGLYQRKDIYGKTILPYKEYLKICDEIIVKEKELEKMK